MRPALQRRGGDGVDGVENDMSIATTLLALLIEATAGYPERVLRAAAIR